MYDLKKYSLFRNLPDDVLKDLSEVAIKKDYIKGDMLFTNEDILSDAEYFYVIDKGWIKIFTETFDGQEAITDILSDHSFFGEDILFQQESHENSAEAIDPTTLLLFPIALFKRYITHYPSLAFGLLEHISNKKQQKEQEIEHLNVQNAPQRIGCFLLRLTKGQLSGKITLNLPYEKTLLASRLGMKAETFSRALSKLKKETDITIHGGVITINAIETLVKYSCSACSSSFPCKDIENAES